MAKTHYTIAVLGGDGIGPEVIAQAVRVLEAIGKRYQLKFTFQEAPVGGASFDQFGEPLTASTMALVQASDALLFGAVGGPKYDNLPRQQRPEQALLRLRRELGLYANLRPAKVYPPLADASTLKRAVVEQVDILVIRELTGDLYFGTPRGIERSNQGRRGVNTMVYTDAEIARIAKVAFEAARGRRKLVTSVDKANILETCELWREVVIEVSQEYPDVQLNHLLVDNCAMQL
ncbi:MAG: 3-isopropylmalate dehydrogenase, partial [Deinococcus sp.]|nr:3-isopropylmalate dehydrogenase [Deinococcus sp.]